MIDIESIATEILDRTCTRCGYDISQRTRSQYCQICAKWVNNQSRKEYTHDVTKAVRKPQHGAIIDDPMCGRPHTMNLGEARKWLHAGQFPAGVTVIIGDEIIKVEAEQRELI